MAKQPNSSLSALLARVDWKPETFARRLNTAAVAAGTTARVHVKTPYKWLSGQHPHPPWPALAAAVLSEKLGTAIAPADAGWSDSTNVRYVPASAGLAQPWMPGAVMHALEEVGGSVPCDRRQFLVVSGATLTGPIQGWSEAQKRDSGGLVNVRLDHRLADELDTIAAQLRRMDDQGGSGPLIELVQAQLRYVRGMLHHNQHTDSMERRLHGVVAELLRLAGWLSFDSSKHAQAQRYWLAGLHAAHSAGDRALGANIVGFMSCQAKDIGEPQDAVSLAVAARSAYSGASSKVRAILDLRVAEAYANAGESTACRRAVDSALDGLSDKPPESGTPDWAYWIDEAQAHAQAGYCYLTLGDWPKSRTHLGTALRAQSADCSREGALRQILLATTYARQSSSEIDRAATLGHEALKTLSADVRSVRCEHHLTELAGHLRSYRRSSAACEFVTRVDHALRSSPSGGWFLQQKTQT